MKEATLPQGTIRYRDSGHRRAARLRPRPAGQRPSLGGGRRAPVPRLPLHRPRPAAGLALDADETPTPTSRPRASPGWSSISSTRSASIGSPWSATTRAARSASSSRPRRPERVGRLILTNCDAYDNFPPKLFAYFKPAAKIPGALTMLTQSMRIKPLRRTPIAFGVLTKITTARRAARRLARPGDQRPADPRGHEEVHPRHRPEADRAGRPRPGALRLPHPVRLGARGPLVQGRPRRPPRRLDAGRARRPHPGRQDVRLDRPARPARRGDRGLRAGDEARTAVAAA